MKIHIVRPGEQLWDLVQKYNVPLERVLEANPNIMEPEQLEVGSKVRIPTGRVPVSPLKRDYLEEVTDGDLFEPQKSFDPTESSKFELQPVVSRPESIEQNQSWDCVESQDLQLIRANPIPVEKVHFDQYNDDESPNYDEYDDETPNYDDYNDDLSEMGVDEWESSTMHSFKPAYASPFLPFYPTEPGFYPHPQLSFAPTMYPSPPPCTDCGPSYSPQVAMSAPPYPFWTPYNDPALFQPSHWYNQEPESAYVEWDKPYESSSAEF